MERPIPDVALLHELGEHLAAGYCELPEASPLRRWSRAVRRRWEHQAVAPYAGGWLWPQGPARPVGQNALVAPSFSFTWEFDDAALQQRLATAEGPLRETLLALQADLRALQARLHQITTPHTVGGSGYTHSIPNYGRVLREGLAAHERRVAAGLQAARLAGDAARETFFLAMQDVLVGIRAWHRRLLDAVRSGVSSPQQAQLAAALERVPWQPPRSFYEALVAYNLVYYLDDCDNPGCLDQELQPYLAQDLRAAALTREQAVAWVRAFWQNVDGNNGWSAAIGGTAADGSAAYGELTTICLEAAQRLRRPNLQLHVRAEMPEAVWQAAFDTLASGCGLPALYHDEAFIAGLRETGLDVAAEDIGWYSGGGCTETMIHGCSNVGSLDAGLNLPLILADTLSCHLASAPTFEDLIAHYEAAVSAVVAEMAAQVNADQRAKAAWRPQPMRTLLVDDCLERGQEFNSGGARYNWSVINVAGLANVIDALAALQEVVYERHELTGAELLAHLQADWPDEALRRRMARCPRYGNDDQRADALALRVARQVFEALGCQRPWRGGRFMPSCLMFVTYGDAGRPVMATPDGRHAGEPLADSAGPYQGRDRHGPTAMLRSVAALPQHLAAGTLCVNLRLARSFFAPEGRAQLRDLVQTYFALGGMQLQINVVDQATLEDAICHPERHADLIVRVGGYSEYFNRLTPALQQTLLQRVEHASY